MWWLFNWMKAKNKEYLIGAQDFLRHYIETLGDDMVILITFLPTVIPGEQR
jgi:hypothetical protein